MIPTLRPRRDRASTRARAFTLIETIAAIVVLAVAIPPMFWSLRDAHVQRAAPVLASRARWLAVERLEDAIADRHSLTRGFAWVTSARYAAETPVAGAPGFTRTTTVKETDADLVSAGTGYKTITVSIGWTDPWGAAKTLTIATVVTEYEP